MAPKADKLSTTNGFGRSKVSEGLIAEYETLAFIEKGKGEPLVLKLFPSLAPTKWFFFVIFLQLAFRFLWKMLL
jgi:hypothetical protein